MRASASFTNIFPFPSSFFNVLKISSLTLDPNARYGSTETGIYIINTKIKAIDAAYLNCEGFRISAWKVGKTDAPPNENAIVPKALNSDLAVVWLCSEYFKTPRLWICIPVRTQMKMAANIVHALAAIANGQMSFGVASHVNGNNAKPQINTQSLNSILTVKPPMSASINDDICCEAKSKNTTHTPKSVTSTQISTIIFPALPAASNPITG